jgi:hypothetical protein
MILRNRRKRRKIKLPVGLGDRPALGGLQIENVK